MVVAPEIREFDFVLTFGPKVARRRLEHGLIRPGAAWTRRCCRPWRLMQNSSRCSGPISKKPSAVPAAVSRLRAAALTSSPNFCAMDAGERTERLKTLQGGIPAASARLHRSGIHQYVGNVGTTGGPVSSAGRTLPGTSAIGEARLLEMRGARVCADGQPHVPAADAFGSGQAGSLLNAVTLPLLRWSAPAAAMRDPDSGADRIIVGAVAERVALVVAACAGTQNVFRGALPGQTASQWLRSRPVRADSRATSSESVSRISRRSRSSRRIGGAGA